MNIDVKIAGSEFSTADVLDAVSFALRSEVRQAQARRKHFLQLCQGFEKRNTITSDEFLARFEDGSLGDDVEYFDWYAAKRGFDLWDRRFRILSGVSV